MMVNKNATSFEKIEYLKSKGVDVTFAINILVSNGDYVVCGGPINPMPFLLLSLRYSDDETIKKIDDCLLKFEQWEEKEKELSESLVKKLQNYFMEIQQ